MPSQLALPSISDSLRTGKRAIVATRDELADIHSGAVFDYLMGTAALAWSREGQADQDKFRAIYLTSAQSNDLTDYVAQRFGIARILDTKGVGTALFTRPTAALGAGTIYAGTQFSVQSPTSGAIVYQVLNDVSVAATQLNVPLAIQATSYGLGVAINNSGGPILDPLWDNSFSVIAAYCQNGTVYESAHDFVARVTSTLLDARPGYITLITQTLQNAGASNIVLFPSNYQGGTIGLNVAYVADAGFGTPQSLLIACRLAVETSRVLGADLMVLGMTNTALSVSLSVSLWDDPSKFDQNALTSTIIAGVLQYFNDPNNSFAYKIDGIRGAAQRVSNNIQDVVVNTPTVDATLSSSAWPALLTRYRPNINTVSVALSGPS